MSYKCPVDIVLSEGNDSMDREEVGGKVSGKGKGDCQKRMSVSVRESRRVDSLRISSVTVHFS